MDNKLFCEYRFKFYLNASHYIFINGKKGQAHPHTWEIILNIQVSRNEFVEFNVFEKEIDKFFENYQNRTLNEVTPFDTLVPTLENMIDYYGEEIGKLIEAIGGALVQIEGSETPTRSYIVNFSKEDDYLSNINKFSQKSVSGVLDKILDEVIE